VGATLAAACVVLLPRITVESDPLTFLPHESQTVEDYARIGERLTGFYSLEVMADLGMPWVEPRQWPALEQLAADVAAIPGVARVLSPLDILRKLNQWNAGAGPDGYALPKSADETRALLGGLDADGRELLARFVDETGHRVRLSILVNEMNSADFNRILGGVESALRALPVPAHGSVTGIVRQLVESQLALVHTQARSFGWALLVIVACMGIGLRSARMALLAIAPNVLPVLAALAIMILAGIPLDAGTVMVASVALGIAVDDTAHVLAGIQRCRRDNLPAAGAVARTIQERGPALVVTTITACAGFAALWRSQFVPIAWFGLLSTVALAVALAADLFLTPAMVLLFARRER
jgi:predicted RND superfamily exporter protein